MNYFGIFNLGCKTLNSIKVTKYSNLTKDVAKPMSFLFFSGVMDSCIDDLVTNIVVPKLIEKYGKVEEDA